MNHLSKRQIAFVAAYLECHEAKAAALKAGYAPSTAHVAGEKLMKKPLIKAEIENERNKIRERTQYTVEKLIQKTDDAIEFARAKGNAMAMVKGVELIGKLTGLLIERQHVQTDGPDLVAALAAAHARLALVGPPRAIDADYREIESRPVVVDIFED
jgi:hypothetical protein